MGQPFEPQQIHPHVEPRVVSYGGVTCFPQPFNSRTIIPPPPGNRPGFDPRYLPENHGRLPYVITQYNGEQCNAFMVPSGVFPVPINQGVHDHLPFSNNHQIFERNRSGVTEGSNGAFKRKNVEGYFRNFQGFYPGYGSSSSVAASEGMVMDATSFGAREHMVVNDSRLVRVGQPTQAVPPDLVNRHGANGRFSWDRAHGVPYLQGCMNGGSSMEGANMGIHGYQVASMSRNSSTFMHPPPPLTSHQGPHNIYHHPPPPVQSQNMDIHLHLASTSHRHSVSTSTGNPFQNRVDPGTRFVGPTPPNGLRVYESYRRETVIESTTRHRSFTNLRVLPEDGVAILDIPDYHEVGPLVDHHNDLRLDIDHMSYEELLALGEQIGNVGSGLSETSISEHLKTRTFRSSNAEDPTRVDEEHTFCVICQMDFEEQEKIGVLDCCHDYHSECIKKWLMVKNACPICKSTAIAL